MIQGDVMIEHFRLTQTAGILHVSTDFFLKISFNLRSESSLPALCVYNFFNFHHSELYLLRFVSSESDEYVMLCYGTAHYCGRLAWAQETIRRTRGIVS